MKLKPKTIQRKMKHRKEEKMMFQKAVCMVMAAFFLINTTVYAESSITTIDGASVSEVTPPVLESESAIVIDVKTGQQLYGKNIYEKQYPASITKIMTCILALENLDLEETITFSESACDIEVGSSAAYVVEGEQIGIKDCLYGMMIHSCNDLANGLAEQVAGSLDKFAVMMTEKAKELGCISTNFKNAHGLDDEEHYTCAYDMAIIGKYAYDTQTLYRDIIKTARYQIEPTNKQSETRYWKNGHLMVVEGEYFYYKDCLGGKTGYTEIAHSTLVTYANINDRVLMCVILDAPSKNTATQETINLFEYCRENISIEYYAQIDKIYSQKLAAENSENNGNNGNGEQSQGEDKKDEVKEANVGVEKEKGKMPLWLKFIIFIITLFVIYYIYICYSRYKRKMRRRQLRMQRRMNQGTDGRN